MTVPCYPGVTPFKGPMGPDTGENMTYAFTATQTAPLGGDGAWGCIIAVVRCPATGPGTVTVFHFTGGDSPDCTLNRFTWPPGCSAIVCGGDDSGQSNCLADAVVYAAGLAGWNVVGISELGGCGVKANGGWYEVPAIS